MLLLYDVSDRYCLYNYIATFYIISIIGIVVVVVVVVVIIIFLLHCYYL